MALVTSACSSEWVRALCCCWWWCLLDGEEVRARLDFGVFILVVEGGWWWLLGSLRMEGW